MRVAFLGEYAWGIPKFSLICCMAMGMLIWKALLSVSSLARNEGIVGLAGC